MFGDLIFREASGPEKAAALRLFQSVYQADIGFVPHDDKDITARHLIAIDRGNTVAATLRLLGPDQRPFPAEDLYPLDQLIPSERRPGLLDHFAVHHDFRRISKDLFLPFAMLKLAFEFAKRLSITDLFLYALPDVEPIYRSAHFARTGYEFPYPNFGRTMAVLRLDIPSVCASNSPSHLINRLLEAPPSAFQLPEQ